MAAKLDGQRAAALQLGRFADHLLKRDLVAVVSIQRMQTGGAARRVVRLGQYGELQSAFHRGPKESRRRSAPAAQRKGKQMVRRVFIRLIYTVAAFLHRLAG